LDTYIEAFIHNTDDAAIDSAPASTIIMASNIWDIFDSFMDQTQETNVCHDMAVKISGNEDIEIVFSTSSDQYYEACSVDSLSEDASSHYDYSEPSNSLLLEEEIDEKRARKHHGKAKNATSISSATTTTMTTETTSTRTRTISNSSSGKTPSAKSVFVDIDEFHEEQDRRDKERRQRRQRRERKEEQDDDEMDGQDDGPRRNDRSSGPLQRKGSEETEDSDIDDSLVFEDDFVTSFDEEGEHDDDCLVYDADDPVMELVDDDDIDDDDALTRLIDIRVGDMMDGSSHMDKISMRLRPTFELPPMPAAPATSVETSNTVTPILPNHSKSNSRRRQLLSLPQIVEQEAEDDQEGSERQSCIEEIEDPHLRTLLKTISRTSKCSEHFDMDALMEHFQKEDVQNPTIHTALENLKSRIRNANPKSKSSKGAQIEEIDLDLFFDDIRKGVQKESRNDATTKRKQTSSTEDRDGSVPSPDLLFHISDDIVLERGMSSLTMGHKTCISASTIEDSLVLALNTPLFTNGNNNYNENKVHHSANNIFSRSKNKRHKAENYNTKEASIQPFSTLNNKGNLSKLLKQKLTRNSTKMGKTVGKLLSITPSSPMENSATFTKATVSSSICNNSATSEAAKGPSEESDDENKASNKTNPSRKNRMAQLWRKTKQGAIGGRRGDSYQTLDPIGERASA